MDKLRKANNHEQMSHAKLLSCHEETTSCHVNRVKVQLDYEAYVVNIVSRFF